MALKRACEAAHSGAPTTNPLFALAIWTCAAARAALIDEFGTIMVFLLSAGKLVHRFLVELLAAITAKGARSARPLPPTPFGPLNPPPGRTPRAPYPPRASPRAPHSPHHHADPQRREKEALNCRTLLAGPPDRPPACRCILGCHLRWVADRLGSARGSRQLGDALSSQWRAEAGVACSVDWFIWSNPAPARHAPPRPAALYYLVDKRRN